VKTLNEIQDEWSIDCKVNELNLGQESTRIPELHSKYLNQLTTFKVSIRSIKSQACEVEVLSR
jgi:hypothetical protein